MAIGRLWAGRAYGTNAGNLFVSLEGDDASLSGTLRLNEPNVGTLVYSVQGLFDGRRLSLTGQPQTQAEGVILGQLTASAGLTSKGELRGEWETSVGAAGTFQLFPHDEIQPVEGAGGSGRAAVIHIVADFLGILTPEA